jgi:hypothetical protein
MELQPSIQYGIYRHFKGGIYEVLGTVRHSETEEWLVLYKSASGSMWVRPYANFVEMVVREGVEISRFTYVGRTA